MVQKAVKRAVLEAGVTKAASWHTIRYAFSTHLLERGQAIHTIQELLGHKEWEHHHALHACAQPRSDRGTKPSRDSVNGRPVSSRTGEPRLDWYSVQDDPLQDKELQAIFHWMPQWFSEGNSRQPLVLGTVRQRVMLTKI